jgi:RNA polymerase sigma-70 factor (ECF subfamily)
VWFVFKNRRAQRQASEPRRADLSTADVFNENAPYAWRVLRKLGVADADVDDVCQEVFITVHRRLPDFEARSAVRTWVYGICVRVAADYRKRVRSRREAGGEVHPEPAVAPRQEDAVSIRQARDTLHRILNGLDYDKRTVFVLYEIEELSMADVASIVGCPLQTAYSRLHAARREVEEAVERLQACAAASTP